MPLNFSCVLLWWNLKSIHWFRWRVEAVLKRSRTRSWPARCSLDGELSAKHLKTEPHPNPRPAGWRWKFHEVRLQLEYCSFFAFAQITRVLKTASNAHFYWHGRYWSCPERGMERHDRIGNDPEPWSLDLNLDPSFAKEQEGVFFVVSGGLI